MRSEASGATPAARIGGGSSFCPTRSVGSWGSSAPSADCGSAECVPCARDRVDRVRGARIRAVGLLQEGDPARSRCAAGLGHLREEAVTDRYSHDHSFAPDTTRDHRREPVVAHAGSAQHDTHAGHSTAAFRDTFWTSLLLTIPTLIWATCSRTPSDTQRRHSLVRTGFLPSLERPSSSTANGSSCRARFESYAIARLG